jgi:hypothetical protein
MHKRSSSHASTHARSNLRYATAATNCAKIPQSLINPLGQAVMQTLLAESKGPNMAGVNTNQLGVNNWFADATYTVSQMNLSEGWIMSLVIGNACSRDTAFSLEIKDPRH